MDLLSETSSDESYKTSEKKQYICTYEGCTASFSKNSKLTYHIRRHTGERPFICEEPNCGKTYLYSFHLRRHKEIHHSNVSVERLVCTHEGCFLELANKYTLRKHMKRKHNPERQYPFSCEECQQGFHRKRQLLQHSYVHTGVFPFTCDLCGLKFQTNRDRNRHKRTHTSYSCACSKTFERWSSLLAHKKTCEIAKPKCNTCKKTFTQQINLKTHEDVHLISNVQEYICGYERCTRSYLYKKNLIYHINKYHRNIALPRIECTYQGCQKTFFKRQNLKIHVSRCHASEEGIKKKQPRAPRKDKGVSRTSAAVLLAGLALPVQTHRAIINKESIELPLVTTNKLICNANEKNGSAESVTDAERESMEILKMKLGAVLSKYQGESKASHSNCNGNDNETIKVM